MRRFASCLLFLGALLALAPLAMAQGAASSEPAGAFNAAGIGTGTRAISGLWQFHLGDDTAWAQPGFDDRGWERLPADQPWGDAGHPGYTGFAWYRRQIALDPADKEPLALLLPPLGSVAHVYWNGVEVGGIGTPPPHANWPFTPQPVAVPLPAAPGARTGELAIACGSAGWDPPTRPTPVDFKLHPNSGTVRLSRQCHSSGLIATFAVRRSATRPSFCSSS